MNKRMLVIILLILFPLPVLADINIECPKEYKENEIIECNITYESKEEVSAFDYKYELSNCSLEQFIIDSSWQGDNQDNELLLYTDVNKSGVFNIGIMKLKVNNSNKINIKTKYLSYFDNNFEEKIIIGKKNVNNEETKEEISKENKKENTSYGIIILIIVVCVLTILIILWLIKKRGVK